MVSSNGEPVPGTYEEAARLLARWHAQALSPDVVVYSFPDPSGQEVHLAEISADFLGALVSPDGVLQGFRFGRSEEFPFRSSTIQMTPQDWTAVQAGRLALPPGWRLDARRQ